MRQRSGSAWPTRLRRAELSLRFARRAVASAARRRLLVPSQSGSPALAVAREPAQRRAMREFACSVPAVPRRLPDLVRCGSLGRGAARASASSSSTRSAGALLRRARHVPERAEHAAIAAPRSQAFAAALADVEELAGVDRHLLLRSMPADRAGDDGFALYGHSGSSVVPLTASRARAGRAGAGDLLPRARAAAAARPEGQRIWALGLRGPSQREERLVLDPCKLLKRESKRSRNLSARPRRLAV